MAGSGTAHLRPERDPVVSVEHLVVEYATKMGTVHAVSDVSFDVLRQETVSLVGESGCGKSSAAKALVELTRRSGGAVRFHGRDLGELSSSELREVRARLQMIFQDPRSSLNPRRPVSRIVAEGLRIWKRGTRIEREEKVRTALANVGLDYDVAAHRKPPTFSGGQCQRISIARALAVDPEVLICDEPVSSLDVSVQAQIINLLAEMKRRYGLTMVFIGHDLAVVRNVSDRVVVMYLGKVCEVGPPEVIFEDPAHPYTVGLLAAVPLPDPAQRDERQPLLAGQVPSPLDPPSGCRFHTRCPRATAMCADVAPEIREIGPEHFVACHFPVGAAASGSAQPPVAVAVGVTNSEARTGAPAPADVPATVGAASADAASGGPAAPTPIGPAAAADATSPSLDGLDADLDDVTAVGRRHRARRRLPLVYGGKALRFLLTVFLVTFTTLVLFNLVPGDPASYIAGEFAPPETIEALNDRYGFDDNVFEQYGRWAGDLVTGDLGVSPMTKQPVWEAMKERLPTTLELALLAMVTSLVISVPIALLCAYRPGSRFDRSVASVTSAFISVPVFVWAIVFVYVFAVRLEIFPVLGWTPISDGLWANLKGLVLPVAAIALAEVAVLTRLLRAELISTLQQDYISLARSKGLPSSRIMLRHALKPASFSVITLSGLQLARLLGGTVLVESIFVLPGLGTLLITAIANRDTVTTLGVVTFVAVMILVLNLLIDLLYGVLDPRSRAR